VTGQGLPGMGKGPNFLPEGYPGYSLPTRAQKSWRRPVKSGMMTWMGPNNMSCRLGPRYVFFFFLYCFTINFLIYKVVFLF